MPTSIPRRDTADQNRRLLFVLLGVMAVLAIVSIITIWVKHH